MAELVPARILKRRVNILLVEYDQRWISAIRSGMENPNHHLSLIFTNARGAENVVRSGEIAENLVNLALIDPYLNPGSYSGNEARHLVHQLNEWRLKTGYPKFPIVQFGMGSIIEGVDWKINKKQGDFTKEHSYETKLSGFIHELIMLGQIPNMRLLKVANT